MLGLRKDDDFQPITWIGKYPIHAATLLVMLHTAALILCTIARAAGRFPEVLAFSSQDIFNRFAFWEFVTYPFVHSPTLWFVVEMYLLFSFGREVEKFLGRWAFLKLYALLLLAPPCILTVWGLARPCGLVGSSGLHFAMFVAFAALYPNTELFFGFVTKWVALVLVGIASLQDLAAHAFENLAVMWVSAGIAYVFIRRIRGMEIIPGIRFRLRRERRVVRMPVARPKRRLPEEEDPVAIIDPLLEKISRYGLESLTQRERERLERARHKLLDRSKDRR